MVNYTPQSNSYCYYTANDLVANHYTLASRSAPSISSPLRLRIKSAWLRPGWIREKFSQWCFVYDIDIQYEAPIWIVSANLESPRPMAVQCAFGAGIFFWTVFWSTKWRVGDDGCAIFLFVKKTRHSIRCPFSYLLRKLTTYECVSFSYTQNPPVLRLSCIKVDIRIIFCV